MFHKAKRGLKTAFLISVSGAAFASSLLSSAFADERRPHNQAEGDNPNYDELVRQGKKKPEANQETRVCKDVPDWDKLSDSVLKLTSEYYPKAKIKKGKYQIHAEFKSRPYDMPSTHKIDIGPEWGGIVFDMQLKEGPYNGIDAVPKKFNEYSYYVVELYAPYSKKFDRHLLTRISYPFDVPPDFLKRFKNLVDEFDQSL